MKKLKPSPAMAVAFVALVSSLTGGAIAATVDFARNADRVDGKHAFSARDSNEQAGGNLVAAQNGGRNDGKIPFKFLADVAHRANVVEGRNGTQLLPVPDNTETTPASLIDLGGITVQAACRDEQSRAGTENPSTKITLSNTTGRELNFARRTGSAGPVIGQLANGTVTTFEIGGENTFDIHTEHGGRTAVIDGVARQAGQGTSNGACGVWATAAVVP